MSQTLWRHPFVWGFVGKSLRRIFVRSRICISMMIWRSGKKWLYSTAYNFFPELNIFYTAKNRLVWDQLQTPLFWVWVCRESEITGCSFSGTQATRETPLLFCCGKPSYGGCNLIRNKGKWCQRKQLHLDSIYETGKSKWRDCPLVHVREVRGL